MRDGRLNVCKQCRQTDNVAYYTRTRNHQLAMAAEWRAANAERKRTADAEYRARPENREKQRAYNREYYERHAEKLRGVTRDWSANNAERKHESDAIYRRTNREKLRAWHREYRRTSPARRAAEKMNTSVRRAQKKNTQVVPFTMEQLEAKWEYWNNCCWVCGDPATTIDHVKPLSRGGAHMLCNLRPACEDCNFARHNTWPLPRRAVILGVA